VSNSYKGFIYEIFFNVTIGKFLGSLKPRHNIQKILIKDSQKNFPFDVLQLIVSDCNSFQLQSILTQSQSVEWWFCLPMNGCTFIWYPWESGRNKIRDTHIGGTHPVFLVFFVKFFFQKKVKDNKVWIRWWSQVNYSQNQTLFIVNNGIFLTGHTKTYLPKKKLGFGFGFLFFWVFWLG